MSITLRFVTCNDLISRTIRSAELGHWASHVEAVTPGGLLGAHIDGGVAIRPHGYDDGEWSKQLYVSVFCTPAQDAAFNKFLNDQIGKAYDLVAIGEMALGELLGEAPNWKRSDTWICSALITGALLMAGVVKAAPATVRLATPRDVLCMLAGLTTIGDPVNPGAK